MLRKLFLALIFINCPVFTQTFAQAPAIQIDVTPVTGASIAGDCLKKGTNGKVSSSSCGIGNIIQPINGGSGISNTGTLTWGNGGTLGTASYANIGISGAFVPLLSTANTWMNLQTISGATTALPGWYAQITGDTFARVRVGLNSTDIASLALGGGNSARDVFLERAGVANLRFGAPDAASPVAQTISVQNVATGTSNTAGVNTTFAGSRGTGTGAGGSLIFKTAAAAGSGTSQNSLSTVLSLAPDLSATFGGTVKLKTIVETSSALTISGNTLTVDLSSGATVYTATSNANITTFTITNASVGSSAFTLILTGDGNTHTQAWGAPVLWPNGVPPSLTTTLNKRDVITFISTNSGTDWLTTISQNF